VTEKAHPGAAALEPGGVREWEEPGEEEWAAQGRAQGQRENASVRNAARLYLMRLGFPVTIGNAPNVVKRWYGNKRFAYRDEYETE
jgi:hypothetical protein